MNPYFAPFLIAATALPMWARGQNTLEPLPPQSPAATQGWQRCSALGADPQARLSCFDQWASSQASTPTAQTGTATPPARPAPNPATASAHAAISTTVAAPTPTEPGPALANCKDLQQSDLSRYWELESGSDCGTFAIRGYKPISLSVIGSDSVNTQPTSVLADHRAATALDFNTTETRIQLSVRTKVAQGLLTQGEPSRRDSLWFGYTQQSNWQIFSGDLSRPFRTTDHEPELIYIYPTDLNLPAGWRLRYAGLSLNHQSNGQPLPLSRSWNRSILMAGLEKGSEFRLLGKLWYRMPEPITDDDNPEISDLVGRGEITGVWTPNTDNTFGLTVRHSLRAQANGSVKLEWLRRLGSDAANNYRSGLHFHTQLFSGYGDSLIDYNRRRTVLSMGLSLVDW